MPQEFFDHYWDTVRWKEVAREARTGTCRDAGATDLRRSSTISTYSERLSTGEILVFCMKALIP